MSGVRVHDRELLDLGLNLPGFVERSKVIASLPSLGLLTLAAHTPEDWEIIYREFDEIPGDAACSIADEGFGVVAISSLTARVKDAYSLASGLRKLGVRVILGGLHASTMPEEAANHVDLVVQGEGEAVWPQVLSDIDAGIQRSFYSSFRLPNQQAEHRVPRYGLLDISRYNRLTLQTTRGCPLHCSFCGASRLISPFRKKPIPQVASELEAILSIWPRPFLELADDNTFFDKAWSRELVALLKNYPVRWFTETDLSVADDPALLKLLAESGCAQVLVGLESASRENMRGMDRANWKFRTHQTYREKIQRIQDHGISVNGCFILGFDHDDASTFPATLDFIDGLGLAEVQITLLTPFPGTDLRKDLIAQNRLTAVTDWEKYTLFDTTFTPAKMSEEILRDRFHWLMSQVYSDDRTAERKSIKRQCLRTTLQLQN